MNFKKCVIVNGKNSKFFFTSLIVLSVLLIAGCWNKKPVESKLVVVNVLDSSYYDDCHMTGSINIPFEQLEDRMKTLSKDDRYVFYCSNYACNAAPYAASMFHEDGFVHAGVFLGGIVQWYQKGYPCTGSAQLEYLKETNEPLSDEEHPEGVTVFTVDELKQAMTEAKLL